MEADTCRCCGHSWISRGGYRVVAGWHFDCWDEHHSDPTTEWPVGHECVKADVCGSAS